MPDRGGESVAHRALEVADHVAMVTRLARDLPGFLRRPLTVEAARQHVLAALANREPRFLDFVDRAIYRHDRSPYRRLLANAGCERGDLRTLVLQEGIEGALSVLADRGVYVTFDEFKGRRPAVRGSARFTFSDADFDAPDVRSGHYVIFTGGSGGRPRPVRRALSSVQENAAMLSLVLEAYGIDRPRNVFWNGGSPTAALVQMKLGHPIDAWFSPVTPLPLTVRTGLTAIAGLARLAGQRMPLPEYCDLADPEPIARQILRSAGSRDPVFVNATVSSAVRIAEAAIRIGRPLTGVVFRCRSEPTTAARRGLIEQAGARALPDYGAIEVGFLGFACPNGTGPDDLHLCSHLFAAVRRERELFDGGTSVDALLVTTLGAADGKIAFNLETGDSARIEQRDCGCLLAEPGMRTHLSEIRSFEKLSSEGTTFVRSNVLVILEEFLPARFGGSAVDYQIVEEEVDGLGRLILRVHPNVGPLDEAALRAVLLSELGRGGPVDAYQADLIRRAASIVIQRLPPIATRAGKVLPLYLPPSVDRGLAPLHAAGPE